MDSARVDSVYMANTDTVVTARGSVRWKPEIRVSVNEANAIASGHRFHARSPFTVYRRGDVLSTPGMTIDTPRGFANVEGTWNVTRHDGRLRPITTSRCGLPAALNTALAADYGASRAGASRSDSRSGKEAGATQAAAYGDECHGDGPKRS
jgi:hypothetical protein